MSKILLLLCNLFGPSFPADSSEHYGDTDSSMSAPPEGVRVPGDLSLMAILIETVRLPLDAEKIYQTERRDLIFLSWFVFIMIMC